MDMLEIKSKHTNNPSQWLKDISCMMLKVILDRNLNIQTNSKHIYNVSYM